MTSEPVTVTLRRSRDGEATAQVQGTLVVPGLAITPAQYDEGWFRLIHVGSGLAFMRSFCPVHIGQAAAIVAAGGIDWTAHLMGRSEPERAQLVALAEEVDARVGRCRIRHCGQDIASYKARCRTCGWELDDSDGDGPYDADEIREEAVEHVCRPLVEVLAPGGDPATGWYGYP